MAIIENFDSLDDGDLNGQNSWSGSTNFDVQSTIYKAGSKACKYTSPATTTYYSIAKTFTEQDETTFTFYARKELNSVASGLSQIRFHDDTTQAFRVQFNDGGGLVFYATSTATMVASYTVATWYKIDIEIRSSDSYGRCRVDDGTWTSWLAPQAAYTAIDKVDFICRGSSVSNVTYFDEISYTSDITLVVATMALVLNYGNVTLTKATKLIVDTMAMTFTFADVMFNNAMTLIVDTMALSLNFADVVLKKASKLIVGTMALVLDFKDVILKKIGWTNETKPTSSWTEDTKPTSSWTNEDK